MKQFLTITLLVAAVLCLESPMKIAHASEDDWKAGLRAGLSFPSTSRVFDGFSPEAKAGPIINAQLLYRFNKYLHLGSMAEVEYHNVTSDVEEANGTILVASLFPVVVEVGPGTMKGWNPYGTLGVGFNVNSFIFDDGEEIARSNTLALRTGVGVDYFLSDSFALNAEVAWKLNDGAVSFEDIPSIDYQASTLSVLLGIRKTF